jgi:SET domain-containing protein
MTTEIHPSNKIYIKFINKKKGWGVFCKEKIEKNEIVETCYCIVDNHNTTSLKNYVYNKNNTSSDVYYCFGFGSLYNHSDIPNIKFRVIDEDKHIVTFTALKDIDINEELCIYYGDNAFEKFQNIYKII